MMVLQNNIGSGLSSMAPCLHPEGMALIAVDALESDDILHRRQLSALRRKAQRRPLDVISDVLTEYREWAGFEAFPRQGDGEWPIGALDRLPSAEFQEKFCERYYRLTQEDGRRIHRAVLISLAHFGVVPSSAEWLEGVVYRSLGIPRLGVEGEWGRGWLFANHMGRWEGLKGTQSLPTMHHDLMSPAEWRWAVQAGKVAEPWSWHGGQSL